MDCYWGVPQEQIKIPLPQPPVLDMLPLGNTVNFVKVECLFRERDGFKSTNATPREAFTFKQWSGPANEMQAGAKRVFDGMMVDIFKATQDQENGHPYLVTSKRIHTIDGFEFGRKHYPSYLRAVPLRTEEKRVSEKETPFIDLDTTQYHVEYAVHNPYMLIPVPEKNPHSL